MRKIFIFALAAMIIFALPFTVFAVSGSSGTNEQVENSHFIDLSSDCLFDITVYSGDSFSSYSSGNPTFIGSSSQVVFEWSPLTKSPVNGLYLTYSRPHSSFSPKLYINGKLVNLHYTGVVTNALAGYYSEFSGSVDSVKLVISGQDVSIGYTLPLSIVSLQGLAFDSVSVSTGYFFKYATFSTYSGGSTSYKKQDLNDYSDISGLNAFLFEGVNDYPNWKLQSYSSDADDLFSLNPFLVVPTNQFAFDAASTLSVQFATFHAINTVSATVSSSLMSAPHVFSDDTILNCSIVGMDGYGETGTISSQYDYGLFYYRIDVDLTGLDLRNKYINISFDISPAVSSNRIAYFDLISMKVRYDIGSSNTLGVITNYLNLIYSKLGDQSITDYSVVLDQINDKLSSILTAFDAIPNYGSYLIDLYNQLTLIVNGIGSVNDWLNNFSPDSGSDLNISIGNAHQSSEELHDQLQILETTPRLSVDQMQDVLQYVDSVGSEVSGDVNVDPGDDDGWLSEPVTLTTPLGYLFNGSSDMSALIGQMLLLVTSLALIGYVLFGKR